MRGEGAFGNLERKEGQREERVGVGKKREVVETQDERKLYTSQDKFNYLAEKYPVIVDLKQRFGLDTDF